MDQAGRLWDVVEPYTSAEGIELDDIEIVGREGGRIVRVVVDAPSALGVDRIAELSRGLSRLMDHDDLIPGSYTLEVTSPGLERKLRRREHYRKSLGREIKVKTRVAVAGSRTHRGDLVSATDRGFTVDVGDSERYIDYDDVASARTVFVWGAKVGQNS